MEVVVSSGVNTVSAVSLTLLCLVPFCGYLPPTGLLLWGSGSVWCLRGSSSSLMAVSLFYFFFILSVTATWPLSSTL